MPHKKLSVPKSTDWRRRTVDLRRTSTWTGKLRPSETAIRDARLHEDCNMIYSYINAPLRTNHGLDTHHKNS